jgi:hypothetical protein
MNTKNQYITHRSVGGNARITLEESPFCATRPWKVVINGTVRAYRETEYGAVLAARGYGCVILTTRKHAAMKGKP